MSVSMESTVTVRLPSVLPATNSWFSSPAWANCGEVACGWQAMERLREQGLRPDWWTFNTLIKMHALQGDKEGAFRAFQAMQAEGKANGSQIVGQVLSRASKFEILGLQSIGCEASILSLIQGYGGFLQKCIVHPYTASYNMLMVDLPLLGLLCRCREPTEL